MVLSVPRKPANTSTMPASSSNKVGSASPVANKSTTQQPSDSATTKKPRKNPARRKAERLNSGVELSTSDLKTKPETGQSRHQVGCGVSSGKTSTTAAPVASPKANSNTKALPAKLSRQVSAPSVLNNAKTSTNTTKPPLQSRKSAAAASSSQSPITKTANVKSGSSTSTSATIAKTTSQSPREPQPNSSRQQIPNKPNTNAPYLTTGSLLAHLTTLTILPIIHASHDLGGPQAALATALSARLSINNLLEEIITSLRAGTYSADEALDVLRRGALGTAGEMRDGKGRVAVASVVEGVAREVERLRVSRGGEWEGVVRGFVNGRSGGSSGATAVVASNGREVGLARLGALVVGIVGDVLGRNPGLGAVREGAVKALGDGGLTAREREIERTARVNLVVRHKSVGT